MTENVIQKIEQGYSESKIQHICVCWFRQTFPHVANLLFSVPNGGWRGPKAGAMMVYEGQIKGVSDLILLYPSSGKACLCLETKAPKRKGSKAGSQTNEQKAWQQLVEKYGSAYVVYHGIMEFVEAVCGYLNIDNSPYKNDVLNKYPLYR